MSHLPIDDEPNMEYIGMAVTGCAAKADDPQPVTLLPRKDAATDLAAVSYTLERLVEQQASVALGYGVHPVICERRAKQVLALWLQELEIAERPREPQDSAI